MIQSKLYYDRPLWEGLKRSLKGDCPRGSFFKILIGSARRQRKPILQLACELDSLMASDYAQASAEDMATVHRLLRKLWKLLDAYEMAFGQDRFWDEVMAYAYLDGQIWLDQAEHHAAENEYWQSIAEQWEKMEQTAFANMEAESGEVGDFEREYVSNRLERYFYHNSDPTDILDEIDAQNDAVRPWGLADYQLFGLEPPPNLQPK